MLGIGPLLPLTLTRVSQIVCGKRRERLFSMKRTEVHNYSRLVAATMRASGVVPGLSMPSLMPLPEAVC